MGDLEDPDLPVVADAATGIPVWRRWLADPLPLLLLTGAAGLAVSAALLPAAGAVWLVPALFAVVVAGLALSGST
ncbi:hypothetical protein BJF86_07240 [Serinicoccus sp. CNJ-927]|uniref:hypothetical protein n=1 Tax=Serinicoccus TaxID=265976 RepID=UPI0003B4CBFB|nr:MULTISPECIES: hypothetical protein [Serinicoccus]OLT17923.1 hypothetical protein BJF80_00995 [Serinicoccus sp. CUA-874]OLT39641.1 hypothetical protein BJF86_07240 [Serinicoccus sp. CNJ-927]